MPWRRQGKLTLGQPEIDLLFRGVDLLLQISKQTEPNIARWEADHAGEITTFLNSLADVTRGGTPSQPAASGPATPESPREVPPVTAEPVLPERSSQPIVARGQETPERVVRLTAENLNRLLGLAGESLVESRWLRPFADSLQRLKRQQTELSERLEDLRQRFSAEELSPRAEHQFDELARELAGCQQLLADRLQELDLFDRRSAQLSQRMYLEVLRTRMRPFSDGVRQFPRMVRDLARVLGKEVRLEIGGENTPVDRDILERLETPLAHLLRNAVDHGCEPPEERQQRRQAPAGHHPRRGAP